MNNNGTSATNDSMNIDAYFESLILDAVGQTDAPLHEALVRSSVYRTINESYERALAQLVIDGELLYANGEYGLAPDAAKPAEPEAVEPDAVESEAAETEALERAAAAPWADEADIAELDAVECDTAEPEAVEVAAEESEAAEPTTLEATAGDATEAEAVEPVAEEPEAVESVTPEDPAPIAFGPISLRADSTLAQLKVNERSWPIPVAVGVSYDKKPADGLSLMGYELPAESAGVADEQQEPARVERPELALSSEPQQLAISFSDNIEAAKTAAESESASGPVQSGLALEPKLEPANGRMLVEEPASVEEPEPEPEAEPVEAAVNKLERPRCLSGWDDPHCVFDTETQAAFLDKQGIHDMFTLVRMLGKAENSDVRSAFELRLLTYAMPLSPQYRAQVPELGKLSGNARFVFDVFGNLRKVGRECCAFADAKGPAIEPLCSVYSSGGEPLSLWNLSISPALQRVLTLNCQIHNMPELLACSWKVLQEKGLTSGEMCSIVSALNDWPAGRLLLGRTKSELELARQAVIGGWYPPVNTPVERVKRVNGLAGEAVLQLRGERLSLYEPSFRLLFCTRLAAKLAAGFSDRHSANSLLAELKNEFPAYSAAVKTFKRLNFELPQDREDIDTSGPASASGDHGGAVDAIATADEVLSDNQLDAQADAHGEESSCESKRPQVQDLTVGQALKLAIDPDAAKFNRWFADLACQDRTLMGCMLTEDKPARWMDSLAKSAWKIRERYNVLMAGRPTFDIDAFGPLFHAYKLTAEDFYQLTNTAQPSYLYMKRVYGQGTIPLKYAAVDKDLAPTVCDVVRAYLASIETENADEPVEEESAPAGQAVASTPEPESASAPEFKPSPEPSATPAPAPEQTAKPFASKVEDLTGKGPMSIDAWLALLPVDDANLLRWIFSDKPLMDYPHKPAGLGPLRQRRADLLRNRPHLDEDKFAPLYQRYDLTEDAFCKITQASPMTFGYLKAVKVSNKFSLRLAANDRTLPQEWRERIAQLNRRPATDALRMPASTEESNATQIEQIARKKIGNLSTRSVALRAFAESGAVKEYHNLKDFRNRYQLFLEENKCGYKMTLALPSDDIRCLNELRGTHMFLVARANKIRAYKVDSRFTSELRQILTLAVGRNIECGAGLIMRENQELCDLYDVHDDEELYEIIRRLCARVPCPAWRWARCRSFVWAKRIAKTKCSMCCEMRAPSYRARSLPSATRKSTA